MTKFILEFYDIEDDENGTIFSMSIPRPDIVLLTLHQPKEEVFFKIGDDKIIKFVVDDIKPRQIIHTLKNENLTKTIVRIPVRASDNGDDYRNIPEWWKGIEIVTIA